MNSLRSLDHVKTAASDIRKALLNVDFGLDNKFCDSNELRSAWNNTTIPDALLSFFAELFNINRASLMRHIFVTQDIYASFEEGHEEFDMEEGTSETFTSLRIKSLFQILYYATVRGMRKTPLQILNAHAIYEKCRSRELITAFNRQCCCSVSYNAMKRERADLAKYTILKSENEQVPLPSNFASTSFTVAAFDNFDNADRNILSGTKHAHDTAITLFQEVPVVV